MVWMELETIMLSKKSVREGQIAYDLIHMWNLRNKTNEHREEKREANQETDS